MDMLGILNKTFGLYRIFSLTSFEQVHTIIRQAFVSGFKYILIHLLNSNTFTCNCKIHIETELSQYLTELLLLLPI